ncbi:DNA-binding response regulator, partial [Jeotgalicoccus huakuii]|nr:DNA-binding response regulator [Jeotgalicoccus huakuii]
MSTTLLVVDDDDEIRELLCDYLTDAGYNVLAAADGEQMREQLAR